MIDEIKKIIPATAEVYKDTDGIYWIVCDEQDSTQELLDDLQKLFGGEVAFDQFFVFSNSQSELVACFGSPMPGKSVAELLESIRHNDLHLATGGDVNI